jgi:hypothetical protein
MTRRKAAFALFVCSIQTLLGQKPTVVYATKEEKAFVDAFNAWAATGNRNGMTVDIKEIKAWRETTHAWARLKNLVEQSYK